MGAKELSSFCSVHHYKAYCPPGPIEIQWSLHVVHAIRIVKNDTITGNDLGGVAPQRATTVNPSRPEAEGELIVTGTDELYAVSINRRWGPGRLKLSSATVLNLKVGIKL